MRRTVCGLQRGACGVGWVLPEGCRKGPHPDKGGPGGVRGLALPPGGELLPAQPASRLPLFAGACSRFLEILEAPAPGQDARAVRFPALQLVDCKPAQSLSFPLCKMGTRRPLTHEIGWGD